MENCSGDTGTAQPRRRRHRSSVTAGRKLFEPGTADGRYHAAIRYKDILEQLQEDLGGNDMLSEAQRQLCRMAATLCAQAEIMAGRSVAGGEFDVSCFATIANSARRLLESIGLERKARDITPSLSNYLQAKAGPP
jgi:hypothetical protein